MRDAESAPNDEPGHDYRLVLPFVLCESLGGPYDDAAHVSGWRLGRLDADLEHGRAMNGTVIVTALLDEGDVPQDVTRWEPIAETRTRSRSPRRRS